MAYAITGTQPTKLLDDTESLTARTVRNAGAGVVFLSRSPSLVSTDADAFSLASGSSQVVWLRPGESLFVRCATGVTASVEVI